MRVDDFEKALRSAFDDKVHVRRDPRDKCVVVYDYTRSGTEYPAYKVACEHCAPYKLGTPREPYWTDIDHLRSMDYAAKYNRRKGAVEELMRKQFIDPDKERERKTLEVVEETAQGPVKDYAKWYSGQRVGITPSSQTRRKKQVQEANQAKKKDRMELAFYSPEDGAE